MNKAIITRQTVADILGIEDPDNISVLAHLLHQLGVEHDNRTIATYLNKNDVGPIIDTLLLVKICRDKQYAFAPCFTIIDSSGRIISNTVKGRCHTNEPISINVNEMARAIISACSNINEIQKKLHIEADNELLYLLGNDDISCISNIPSSRFVSFFLTYGIDMNKFIIQKGFSFPVVSRSPDAKVTTNNSTKSYQVLMDEYLDETLKLKELKTEIHNKKDKLAKFINMCLNDADISKSERRR